MTSLTGDEMTRSLLKFLISLDFNIVGNVWDHVSTYIILHIVPLIGEQKRFFFLIKKSFEQ